MSHKHKLSRKEIFFTMAGAMLTLLLAALDNTIVGTAMPQIIRDLHGMEHYAWPFTAYMLCSTIILPISGKLADIYGRKKITLTGIGIFAVASIFCGLAESMIELSLLRGLQGIGGGICISSAFIIVSEIFPPKERRKYIGLVTSMFAVASILGPGAGGVITDLLSWRWIFYVNIPLGIIAFLLILFWFPNIRHNEERRRIDIAGVVLFVLATLPFLLFLSQIGTLPFLSPFMLGLAAFSLVTFAVFLRVERRSKEPLLSLHFFREKIFSSSVIAASLGNMAVFGAAIYLPLYLQGVRGAGATEAGAIMMPMMVSMIASSNVASVLIAKLNHYKAVALAGLLLATGGIAVIGIAGSALSTGGLILFSGAAGFGIGLTFPVFVFAPQCVFPPRQIGVVTSLLQFFRNLGGSIGSALFGALMVARMGSELGSVPTGSLSSATADLVRNPAILGNPEKLAAVRDSVPDSALADFAAFVKSCLAAVSGSIELVFLFAAVLLLAASISVIVWFNERAVLHAVEEHRKHY